MRSTDKRASFTRSTHCRARIERNREIIRRLKNSNDSLKTIAKDFRTTRQNISLIKMAAGINRAHAPIPGRSRKSPLALGRRRLEREKGLTARAGSRVQAH
jgi:hypothetical protein